MALWGVRQCILLRSWHYVRWLRGPWNCLSRAPVSRRVEGRKLFFQVNRVAGPNSWSPNGILFGSNQKNNIKLPGLSNRSWLFWNTLSSAPVSSITIQPNMCSGTRFVAGGHSILIETRWFSIDRESNLSSMRLKLLGFQSLKGNRGFQSLKDHYINCIVFDISNTTTQCCRKLAVVYHSRQVPTISSRKKNCCLELRGRISPLCPPETFSDTRCGAMKNAMLLVGIFDKALWAMLTA